MGSENSFERFCQSAQERPPAVAIVLGSGLGALSDRLRNAEKISFLEIPDLGLPSVVGHQGTLLLGEWAQVPVLVFGGRLHYYEGHPWRKIVEPVRIALRLGVKTLLLTNAAGGIADVLHPGDVMAISDHLEWTRPFYWRHPGPAEISPVRPSPYSARLIGLCQQAAMTLGRPMAKGVYAHMTGPCYETPAEIRALKKLGADAVGMSTAREIQMGYDLGLECAALSFITNKAAGLCDGPIHHEEVLTTAAQGREFLADLVEGFLKLLAATR